jgi:flagellar motor switch/type III secretory pathway protein FliN
LDFLNNLEWWEVLILLISVTLTLSVSVIIAILLFKKKIKNKEQENKKEETLKILQFEEQEFEQIIKEAKETGFLQRYLQKEEKRKEEMKFLNDVFIHIKFEINKTFKNLLESKNIDVIDLNLFNDYKLINLLWEVYKSRIRAIFRIAFKENNYNNLNNVEFNTYIKRKINIIKEEINNVHINYIPEFKLFSKEDYFNNIVNEFYKQLKKETDSIFKFSISLEDDYVKIIKEKDMMLNKFITDVSSNNM